MIAPPRCVRVLCIDGGLADLGWCVATLFDSGRVIIRGAGVVHTTKTETGKAAGSAVMLGTTVSADSMRRACIVSARIGAALRENDPRHDDGEAPPLMVAVEEFTPPRGAASAALKVGFGIGAALSAAVMHGAVEHLARATAGEVKRVLGVKAGLDEGASKAAVRSAVEARFPELGSHLDAAKVPNGRREHAYDAAGVLLACIDRDRFAPILPMLT